MTMTVVVPAPTMTVVVPAPVPKLGMIVVAMMIPPPATKTAAGIVTIMTVMHSLHID